MSVVCLELNSKGESCSNPIYCGLSCNCYYHWRLRAENSSNDDMQKVWEGFSIKPLDCEFCKVTIVEHLYAEHQTVCTGQNTNKELGGVK